MRGSTCFVNPSGSGRGLGKYTGFVPGTDNCFPVRPRIRWRSDTGIGGGRCRRELGRRGSKTCAGGDQGACAARRGAARRLCTRSAGHVGPLRPRRPGAWSQPPPWPPSGGCVRDAERLERESPAPASAARASGVRNGGRWNGVHLHNALFALGRLRLGKPSEALPPALVFYVPR